MVANQINLIYSTYTTNNFKDEEANNWAVQYHPKQINLPIRKYFLDLNARYFKNFIPTVDNEHCFQNPFIKIKRDVKTNLEPYSMSLGPTMHFGPNCTNPFDKHNLVCGYLKRLSPLLPIINPLTVIRLRAFVKNFLIKNLKPIPLIQNFQNDVANWLNHVDHYTQKRKEQLKRYAKLIEVEGLGNPRLLEKHYLCKSFVKREFYEDLKNLRFINSRSDFFKVRVGPYIKLVEEQLYKLPYFIKHEDIMDIPKRLYPLRNCRYFLQTDYSAFESSFSPQYVDAVECELWRYMFQNNKELLHDVMHVYYTDKRVNGFTRRTVRTETLVNKNYVIKAQGIRLSGEMWTSLANGFSNLMNMLFLAHEKHCEVNGLIEGDDGIFGMSEPKFTVNDFASLGFIIKMKYVRNIEDTNFCSNIFNLHDMKLLIEPEQLCRLFWTNNPLYFNCSNKVMKELLKAKAMSLYCLAKYTPILSIFTLKVIDLLRDSKFRMECQSKWWDMYLVKWIKDEDFVKQEITMFNRLIYFKHFGVSIDEQIAIERNIIQSKSLQELADLIPMVGMKNPHFLLM